MSALDALAPVEMSTESVSESPAAATVDVVPVPPVGITSNGNEHEKSHQVDGGTLPPTPSYALLWDKVTYSVEIKIKAPGQRRKVKVSKEILHGITGNCKPMEMMAVMGTSGAGKTTLLNVLAGRNVPGDVGGSILYNHEPRSKKLFRKQSAYVEQDDMLFPNLSVKETFRYAALLRLPKSMSVAEKFARAAEVIQQLGLRTCEETKVGDSQVRGISGGERKRTSVGLELITNPRLLFLDEPTSGLDSFSALHVMESMRELAKADQGRAIVATIHQPRANIFALFDKLMLLSQGHVVYYGPAAQAVDFFNWNGHPCPPLSNPADFFLDVTTVDTRSKEREERTQATNDQLIQGYRTSYNCRVAEEEAAADRAECARLQFTRTGSRKSRFSRMTLRGSESPTESPMGSPRASRRSGDVVVDMGAGAAGRPSLGASSRSKVALMGPPTDPSAPSGARSAQDEGGSRWNLSWLAEFAILYRRAWKNYIREKRVVVVGFAQAVIMSCMAGFIFFDLGDNQQSIQNRSGALFFIVLNQCFGSLFGAINMFHMEKPIFLRERSAGTYRVSTYYMAKSLSELPVLFLFPAVYSVIAYWLVGLNPIAGRFFTFLAILMATTLCAHALGLCISAATPNMGVAQAVTPIVMILFMLFGGFYLNNQDVWRGFIWIQYISFVYYGYGAVMVNEYKGMTFQCSPNDSRCDRTGEQVLDFMDMGDVVVWENVGILVALTVAFRFIAYAVLRWFSKPKMKIV